jgi:RpiB/LacA/LacB family sugar-phosphate isomerase
MRVAFASDHAGFEMKNDLLELAKSRSFEVLDVGPFQYNPSDDYPDFAEAIGVALRDGKADRGVLICGSGVGASIAAAKMHGIRAAVCHDSYSAHQGVEHDDMNVLVLGARIIGSELARDLMITFLGAKFSGEERHRRRLAKVSTIEQRYR